MGTIAYIILSAIGIIVLIFAVWHAGSRRFELPCPVWLRWMVEIDNPFTKTCWAQTIIEHLGLEPGMSVLDAGCGPGRLTIPKTVPFIYPISSDLVRLGVSLGYTSFCRNVWERRLANSPATIRSSSSAKKVRSGLGRADSRGRLGAMAHAGFSSERNPAERVVIHGILCWVLGDKRHRNRTIQLNGRIRF
jgi:hypothetical protein